jgi:hypothetical protein
MLPFLPFLNNSKIKKKKQNQKKITKKFVLRILGETQKEVNTPVLFTIY